MKKSILMLAALLLCLTCDAQVRDGDNVIMPIETYRGYRTAILECDTIKDDANKMQVECDSIIALQDRRIQDKDSIITNLNHKIELKDQVISILEKPKHKIHIQAWIGALFGAVGMALMLR